MPILVMPASVAPASFDLTPHYRSGRRPAVQYMFLIPFGYDTRDGAPTRGQGPGSLGGMKLHQLRYFVAVAEEMHFGRAASRLRIAQPPLSRQIHELEAELGTRLFNRTQRRVALTDAGRVLLEEVRLILAHVDRAADAARRAGQGEIGQLVLGVVPTVDGQMFTRILHAFAKRYPKVHVAVRSLSTAALVQGLGTGALQAAFVRLPVRDDGLTVRLISREPLVATLPATHPLARSARLSLAALADEPHVIFPRELAPAYYDLIVSLYQRAGLHLRIAQETEHVQTILGLVAGGFGVSLLPASIREFRMRGVVYRTLRDRVPPVETAVAYRRDDPSEILRAFIAVIDRVAPRLPR
jgi:DNA-binding transcriptional LysR family regulator